MKERFLEDVKQHEMIIWQDDGLFRHITFKNPEKYCYLFSLTTFPGHLTYSGDMGTFVFRRVHDMFTFFRNDKLEVNHNYWHEKLISVSRFGGDTEWDEEKFRDTVEEKFNEHVDETHLTAENKNELWEELKYEVLEHSYQEDVAMRSAIQFDSGGLSLYDFWEYNFHTYTLHFSWCLYAMVWGIQQYDAQNPKALDQSSR